MSGSDEELDAQAQSGMSKAELRRSNKPIMEKRRRARINQCLDELKSLILEAMKKDPSRHSKLEKADILEMTVKHLQTIQRQQLSTAVATDPAVLTKFRTGFSECANEVSRYVNHLENVDTSVKQRLVSHLNNCVNNLHQMAPFYSHYVPYMPDRLFPEVKVGFQSDFHSGDENNNASTRIQIPSGVQLIPSRLPTGELALLVPQSAGISANFPFFPPAPETSSRIRTTSAFTPVQRSHSPLLSPSTSTSSFGDDTTHHQDQYRHSESPINDQNNFKVPDQNSSSSSKSYSSPETQKSHISSTTADCKSPISAFTNPKCDLNITKKFKSISQESMELSSVNNTKIQHLRQPLSVITDKTYNNRTTIVTVQSKRENLKRHHSDGLLVISDKRTKYQDTQRDTLISPVCSTSNGNNSNNHRIREENFTNSIAVEDLSRRTNSRLHNDNEQHHHHHVQCTSGSSASQANGDMWRPW